MLGKGINGDNCYRIDNGNANKPRRRLQYERDNNFYKNDEIDINIAARNW